MCAGVVTAKAVVQVITMKSKYASTCNRTFGDSCCICSVCTLLLQVSNVIDLMLVLFVTDASSGCTTCCLLSYSACMTDKQPLSRNSDQARVLMFPMLITPKLPAVPILQAIIADL